MLGMCIGVNMAIVDFDCKHTAEAFKAGKVPKKKGWSQLIKVVKRKLDMLDYASCLEDLKAPPANRLEPLRGNLKGYHSIRVNDQWRIIFRWTNRGAESVQVVDYH